MDLLRDQLRKCHVLNPPLAVKFKDIYFFKAPYMIYSYFLELSKYSGDPSPSQDDYEPFDTVYLDKCLA